MAVVEVTETTDQAICNRRLLHLYGKHADCDKARFRVVNAEKEITSRFGEFEDWTEAGIFIRKVKETRVVPKYPHLGNQWIVERLLPNFSKAAGDDPMGENYEYYCIWAFPEGLPLSFRAADLLIKNVLGHFDSEKKEAGLKQESQKETDYFEAKKKEKAVKEIENRLDTTEVEVNLHHGSGVSMAGLDGRSESVRETFTTSKQIVITEEK